MKKTSSMLLVVVGMIVVGGLAAGPVLSTDDGKSADDSRVVTSSLVAAASPSSQDDEPDDGRVRTLKDFMRQKLKASNQILEGLMVDDMTMVDKAAGALLTMSKAEQWRASNDVMYLQHSREFSTAVEEMQKKAQKDSLDGASLAWINVTMKCIQCHEWVRNTVIANAGIRRQDETQITEADVFLPAGNRLR
ncbi:MAG: hypothetical protein R3C19_23860 [Planctomycetaceae bacterium]